MSRFVAERSTFGVTCKARVYDFETRQIARHFTTLDAAERWAESHNAEARRQVTHEPRMRLLGAATRAGGCHDRRDYVGESYWQAEADAARIELCVALGDEASAEHWRTYYVEHYGRTPACV